MVEKKKVALVLSSGGARGITQIGIIEELLSLGYEISSISGSSIGAVIGGLYAAGKLDEYKEWVSTLDRFDIFGLVDISIRSVGFIKGERVFGHLAEWLEGINIEDLDIPFSCVATDIQNRTEVIFESGSLLEAIRASVAIPGMFTPSRVNNALLFDGGVINPLPINRIKRTPNDTLIAVDLNAFDPDFEKSGDTSRISNSRINRLQKRGVHRFNTFYKSAKKLTNSSSDEKKENSLSYYNLINGMFDLMQEQISSFTIENNPPDILIQIPRSLCNTFDFQRSKELIKIGRDILHSTLKGQERIK